MMGAEHLDRPLRRRGRCLLAGLFLFGAPAAAADRAAPNLEGVWTLKAPVRLLRTTDGELPPFKPEALTTYLANLKLAAKQDYSFDATKRRCSSPGMPRIMTIGWPFNLIERSDQVIMLFSWNRMYRQIPITASPPQALYPTAIGTTTGHWEGGALVVTTTGRDDATLLDDAIPSSESLEIVERIGKKHNMLEDRMTITDPAIFTKPWQTTLKYREIPVEPDTEDVCLNRLAAGKPALP